MPGDETGDREHWTTADQLAALEEECWPLRNVLDTELRQDFDEMWSKVRRDSAAISALNPQRGLIVPALLLTCVHQQHQLRRLQEVLDVDLEQHDTLRWDCRNRR